LGDEFVEEIFNLDSDEDRGVDPIEAADEEQVVNFVNKLLLDSFKQNYTAISLQPTGENFGFVREKYQGQWLSSHKGNIPNKNYTMIVARIKIMAYLDIAERRIPQNGLIKIKLSDTEELKIAVTTMPTVHGEAIGIRFQPSVKQEIKFDDLNLNEQLIQKLKQAFVKNGGLVLAAGPPESGRLTSLFALTERFLLPEKWIVYVGESYRWSGLDITHSEINQKTGYSHSYALRSARRMDADAIILDDIVDLETARLAVETASNGKWVLARIPVDLPQHAIKRLLDMGVEHFLIASSLELIVRPCLVPLLCQSCKVKTNDKTYPYTVGKCEECKYTGYHGVRSIFDMLFVDPEVKNLIAGYYTNNNSEKLRSRLTGSGESLRQQALALAREGIITPEKAIELTTFAK